MRTAKLTLKQIVKEYRIALGDVPDIKLQEMVNCFKRTVDLNKSRKLVWLSIPAVFGKMNNNGNPSATRLPNRKARRAHAKR